MIRITKFQRRRVSGNEQYSACHQYQVQHSPPSRLSSSPPSPTNYHVWGANAMNWNLREGQTISGGGMAAAMGIQKKGVFGIVTTPQ